MIRRIRRAYWHFIDDLKDMLTLFMGCFAFWCALAIVEWWIR